MVRKTNRRKSRTKKKGFVRGKGNESNIKRAVFEDGQLLQ